MIEDLKVNWVAGRIRASFVVGQKGWFYCLMIVYDRLNSVWSPYAWRTLSQWSMARSYHRVAYIDFIHDM